MKEGSKYQPLLEFLRRTIRNGGFEIMFEPPDDVKDIEE
jgi:hypothetical protein